MNLTTVSRSLSNIKSFNAPLGHAKTACELGLRIPSVRSISKKASKRLAWISGPLNAVSLVADRRALFSSSGIKTTELSLSILKKGCEVTRWANWCGVIALDVSFDHSLKGMSSLTTLAKASLRLWKDLQADPSNRRLASSVPKFLNASLLLCVYVVDNKTVKFYLRTIVIGIEVIRSGYSFYLSSKKITYNPAEWSLSSAQARKVISSIAFTCIAFYVIEINVDFDSLA